MLSMHSTAVYHSTRSIAALPLGLKAVSNRPCVFMRKRDIHPKYFDEAKVYCKGEHVLTVSGTQPEYHVEIWSGNHPFYQGKQKKTQSADEDRLARFIAKYPGNPELMQIPNLGPEKPQVTEPPKSDKKKKSKKD